MWVTKVWCNKRQLEGERCPRPTVTSAPAGPEIRSWRAAGGGQRPGNSAPAVAGRRRGAFHIYQDVGISGTSGTNSRRDWHSLDSRLAQGDTLVVVSIDRIGRRWLDTMGNIHDLQRRGVMIRSLADNEQSWAQYLDADPDSPESFLGYSLAGFAAWVFGQELVSIRRRTKAGLEKAKADGKKLDAPRQLSEEQEAAVIEMVASGVSQRRVARSFGVSPATVRRAELHDNMVGMLRKKFAYIAGYAAVCSAANCVYDEMRNVPATRALIQQAIEEALAVGRASGAPIMDDSLDWAMNSLDRGPAPGRASMAKDFTEGRPVDLERLNGALIRLARRTGTPTPANDFLYAVLKPAADRIAREHGGG